MTPDIDLWLWALLSGQLEWRPVQFSKKYNVNFCFCTQNILYFKSWIIKKRISVIFVSGSSGFRCNMHDLLYESLFHPLLIHLTAFPPLPSPPARAQLCVQLFPHFLSQPSLILYSITSFFLSLTFLEFWVKLHDCFTAMAQFACCRASLKQLNIFWCVVHLGSVWPNLPLQEPFDSQNRHFTFWEKCVPLGACWITLLRLKWFLMVIHVERPHEDLHYRSFVWKIKGVKSTPYVRYMLWTWSRLECNRPWASLLMDSECSANPYGQTGNLHEIFWFL